MRADGDVVGDVAVGADVGAFGDFCGGRDDGGGMDAGGVGGRLVEKFESLSEGQVGIGSAEDGERGERGIAIEGDVGLEEDGGGLGGAEERGVAAIGEEGELAGGGVVDAGDSGDGEGGIAFELAREFLGEIGEQHTENLREVRAKSEFGIGGSGEYRAGEGRARGGCVERKMEEYRERSIRSWGRGRLG